MFGGSGLDPLKKARNRQRRKAQRYAQRSQGKKAASKGSSSEDGTALRGQTIFGEPQRVRAVALSLLSSIGPGHREYAGVDAFGSRTGIKSPLVPDLVLQNMVK